MSAKPTSFLHVVALLLLVGVVSVPALAAQDASPYVALDDWSMVAVEHLIRAGVIADPDPMTRPLRARAIVAALQRADTSHASPAVRATVRALIERWSPRGVPPGLRMRLYAGGSAATQARRDPLRDTGPHVEAYHFGDHMTAAFGPVALSSHILLDRRLRFDPDYTGNQAVQQFPGLITDAYVSVQGTYGEFFLGAMQRNWGPTGIDGALVSPEPYAYDHVMARLGTRTLRIESLVTQLDDYVQPSQVVEQRYWATHRLFFQPFRWMTVVITQGTLWFGAGRALEFRWLNPLRLNSETRLSDNASDSVKLIGGGQFRLALPHGAVLQGDMTIGDLHSLPILFTGINPVLGSSGAPSRVVETVVLDVPVSAGATLRGLYTVVTNLMYRSALPEKTVALRGVGLGRNFADYSQYTLSASLMPRTMVVLSPELTWLKQGEGDFRTPFTACPCDRLPMLYAGVAERTIRTALSGRLQVLRHLDVDGSAAVHFVNNRNHVLGNSATRFVGGISLTYWFDQAVRLP